MDQYVGIARKINKGWAFPRITTKHHDLVGGFEPKRKGLVRAALWRRARIEMVVTDLGRSDLYAVILKDQATCDVMRAEQILRCAGPFHFCTSDLSIGLEVAQETLQHRFSARWPIDVHWRCAAGSPLQSHQRSPIGIVVVVVMGNENVIDASVIEVSEHELTHNSVASIDQVHAVPHNHGIGRLRTLCARYGPTLGSQDNDPSRSRLRSRRRARVSGRD